MSNMVLVGCVGGLHDTLQASIGQVGPEARTVSPVHIPRGRTCARGTMPMMCYDLEKSDQTMMLVVLLASEYTRLVRSKASWSDPVNHALRACS